MATFRALVVCALTVVFGVSLAPAALAAGEANDQIVLTGAVTIPRGADVGEVFVVRGSARIDGVAHGDVVVVDGSIVIRGQVSGDVVAVDGRVVLASSAQVNGDVSARGVVAVARGAQVGGRIRQHVAYGWRTPIDAVGRFASWLAVSVSTLLLGLLLVLLAPRALDSVAGVARSSVGRSAGWGLALAVGVPVFVVLLLASLVALPLGLVTLLAFGFVGFVGYVLAAYAIGRSIRPSPANRAGVFAVGWAILRAVAAIPVVSGVTFALAAAYGVGAAAVTTWRARATAGRHRGQRRRSEVGADAGREGSPDGTADIPPDVVDVANAPFGEEAGL